ncbi:response regulator transcription factor [Chondrinema litorale]|uniref:response regulator transcription factor n=1 Tax=Chondrinema litorale TaxID=2994555 RepID=UPI002543ED4C|nr:response regulator transcription factor [Chondrinema litorale]UZR98308.1 response regulator transcription factor [Chondrinema litorale]
MKIRTVLASEKKLMIQGLNQLLNNRRKVSVIDLASSYEELMYHIENSNLDLIIIYIGLAQILFEDEQLKEICSSSKILLLTEKHKCNDLNIYLKEGIAGVVTVEGGVSDLEQAIYNTCTQGDFFDSDEIEEITDKYIKYVKHRKSLVKDYNLTPRQLDVLRLIANGKSTEEIAKELLISTYTVEIHKKNMMRKMNVKSSFQMIRYALNQGII